MSWRSGLMILLLTMVAAPALCHHDLRELGHHWAIPAYTHELRVQLLGMAVVAAVLVAIRLVMRRAR